MPMKISLFEKSAIFAEKIISFLFRAKKYFAIAENQTVARIFQYRV